MAVGRFPVLMSNCTESPSSFTPEFGWGKRLLEEESILTILDLQTIRKDKSIKRLQKAVNITHRKVKPKAANLAVIMPYLGRHCSEDLLTVPTCY